MKVNGKRTKANGRQLVFVDLACHLTVYFIKSYNLTTFTSLTTPFKDILHYFTHPYVVPNCLTLLLRCLPCEMQKENFFKNVLVIQFSVFERGYKSFLKSG